MKRKHPVMPEDLGTKQPNIVYDDPRKEHEATHGTVPVVKYSVGKTGSSTERNVGSMKTSCMCDRIKDSDHAFQTGS
jgi:hypothetical protein